MAIATRHFRLMALEPNGRERVNPLWLERLEALTAGGKTEAEAEAELLAAKVPKLIVPATQLATFQDAVSDLEELRLIVKPENVTLGQLYTVTFT